MLRRIVGFALLALALGFALKLVLGLFGIVVALAMTTVCLAIVGYGCYLVLRVLSPGAAMKIRGLITGDRPHPYPSGPNAGR